MALLDLGFLQAVKKIIRSPSDALMIVLSDLPESIRPEILQINMEHLSYSKNSYKKGEEQSAEKNLSMYDSISDYRNKSSSSTTSPALPDGLAMENNVSSDSGEEISYANAENSPSCNEYVYYGAPAENMGIKRK